MTIFRSARVRIVLATLAVSLAAISISFFSYRSHVLAARRAIAIQNAPLAASLAAVAPSPGASPVVVELFTSEGCSSCPPADALLAHLLKDQPVPSADVIALEEHVDYWDSLGWHDRFSSHQLTDRQAAYVRRFGLDDDYTPQMVVDGTNQFVGNDSAHALRAIAQAARVPKSALTLGPVTLDADHIAGTVSVASTADRKADLFAAVVEAMASTPVTRGENSGHTLNHVSAVRSLQRIGSPFDAISSPLQFSLPIPANAAPSNLRVIVFLQRSGQGAILGAVSSGPIPPAAPATATATAPQPALQ